MNIVWLYFSLSPTSDLIEKSKNMAELSAGVACWMSQGGRGGSPITVMLVLRLQIERCVFLNHQTSSKQSTQRTALTSWKHFTPFTERVTSEILRQKCENMSSNVTQNYQSAFECFPLDLLWPGGCNEGHLKYVIGPVEKEMFVAILWYSLFKKKKKKSCVKQLKTKAMMDLEEKKKCTQIFLKKRTFHLLFSLFFF